MSAWAEFGWGLVFAAAMLVVAFNYRDAAWRIHDFMSNRVGVNRVLTPTTVRVVCGVLATASPVSIAFGLARSQ